MHNKLDGLVIFLVSVLMLIWIGAVYRVLSAEPVTQESERVFSDAAFSYGENKSPCIRVMKDGEIREIDLWKLSEGQYDNAERTN